MKEYVIPTIIKPEDLEDETPLQENLRYAKEFTLDFFLSVIRNPFSFLFSLFIVLSVFIVIPHFIQDFKNEKTEIKIQSFMESQGYNVSQITINSNKEEAEVVTPEGEILIKNIYENDKTIYKKIK